MGGRKTRRLIEDLSPVERARLKDAWVGGEPSASVLVARFHLSEKELGKMKVLFGPRTDLSLKRSPWKKK